MFALTLASALSSHLQELPTIIDGWLCNRSRLMVKASGPVANAAARLAGGKVIATFPQIGWSTVEVPEGKLKQSKLKIEAVKGVQKVQYDRAAQLCYTPNDELWPNQWHMRQLKIDLAWDTFKGDPSVIVADIDTGCMVSHPDLAANVNTAISYNFVDNNADVTDTQGHGTGTAGLLGAVQDNLIGVSGACPHLQIMVIKACNDSGYLYDSYLVPSYVYAADHGARVFTMSYFSDRVSQAEKDAMDYAVAHNVLPIAAACNSSTVLPFYPGAYENVMAVGATDENNNRCWFSDYGTWVDVLAPGQDLTTTANGGGYGGFGGTSGATPHIAGIAALLIGANPALTAQEVRNAIEDTAVPINQYPFGDLANYGLADAQAALNAALTVPAPPKSPIVRYIATLGQGPGITQLDPSKSVIARIYGRGFQALQNLQVVRNGKVCNITSRTRDYVDFQLVYREPGDVQVFDGSTLIASVPNPVVRRTCHPLVEAASQTGAVVGNFFTTLMDDGQTMDSAVDSNGNISIEGTFRKVVNNINTQIRITRTYTQPGGSEFIQLYDWQSASYPYGSWVTVSSLSTSTTTSTTVINVPDISRYIDVEGTVYVRVIGSGLPASDVMKVDCLRLQDSK